MSDLEMTELCAQAMGVPLMGSSVPLWNPLHNDAQAMALVKKFGLHISPPDSVDNRWEAYTLSDDLDPDSGVKLHALATDLNRAIVACISKHAKTPAQPLP